MVYFSVNARNMGRTIEAREKFITAINKFIDNHRYRQHLDIHRLCDDGIQIGMKKQATEFQRIAYHAVSAFVYGYLACWKK